MDINFRPNSAEGSRKLPAKCHLNCFLLLLRLDKKYWTIQSAGVQKSTILVYNLPSENTAFGNFFLFPGFEKSLFSSIASSAVFSVSSRCIGGLCHYYMGLPSTVQEPYSVPKLILPNIVCFFKKSLKASKLDELQKFPAKINMGGTDVASELPVKRLFGKMQHSNCFRKRFGFSSC